MLLENIKSPTDIKNLDIKSLNALCKEIRKQIINVVSKNGGHLASNLGIVELSVSLHKIFNSYTDKIIFDVGHQCYSHKLLTGRYLNFKNIRKAAGPSGFSNPEESKHDAFLTGHASTSISLALGVNEANFLNKNSNYTVAVIGDGALTGGLALEALNNAGVLKRNFIIVLNDNEMSIDKNMGVMPNRLLDAKKFFESIGFVYKGPVDGHKIANLIDVLKESKSICAPVLIHVKTIKGKGYTFAEKNPEKFHCVSGFEVKTGKTPKTAKTFSEVFANSLEELAQKDKRICAVTAAMKSGTGLYKFFDKFPERSFDVGIAEEHAVTFSSGLSSAGMIPVFAVYSSFLQRSYDQILHDCSIAKRKIVLAIDRVGVVGEDGKTHNGLFDVSFLSCLPGVTIFAPAFFDEMENMLKSAIYNTGAISCIRYPKGEELYKPKNFNSSLGVSHYDTYGDRSSSVVIITYGRVFSNVSKAFDRLNKNNISVCIIKLNVINPIYDSLFSFVKNFSTIFFFEEGMLKGSVAEHFLRMLIEKKINKKFYIKAIDDEFIEHSTTKEALKKIGLDSNSIYKFVLGKIKKEVLA